MTSSLRIAHNQLNHERQPPFWYQNYFYKLLLFVSFIAFSNYKEFKLTSIYRKNCTRNVSSMRGSNKVDALSVYSPYSKHIISNNLVVINAVSRAEVLTSVLYNTKEHFSKEYYSEQEDIAYKWECLLFLNVDETVIPNDNQYLKEIIDNNYCSI